MKNNLQLPITHFQISNDLDHRFVKVKIWIAHTGENLNGTVFSQEALLEMAKTLPYVPILGFVDTDEYGTKDFRDHMQRITLTDNDIKQEWLTTPFGFIPHEPNAKIEYREGKEFLTCDGYLWNRFSDIVNLFVENQGRKSQSMEVEILDAFVDDYGRTNVTSGRFTGLCVLGNNVPPAMTGASVDLYSVSSLKTQIQEMISEFSAKEGESTLEKQDLVETEVVEKITETEVEEVVESVEEKTKEEAENTEVETVESEYAENQEETETNTEEETSSEEADVEVFEEKEELEEDAQETTSESESSEEKEDESSEIETVYSSEEVEKLNGRIKELEEELEKEKAKVHSYELSEKQDIVNSYADDLSQDVIDTYMSKLDEYDKVELEKEIVFAIYAQTKKDKQEKPTVTKVFSYSNVNAEENEVVSKYGSEIGSFFK